MNESVFPVSVKSELAFKSGLAAGAKGMKVRRVQEWLSFHGCATSIDDDYGSATTEAVSKFQRANSIKESGNVDQQTWLLLTAPLRKALVDGTGKSLPKRVASIAKQHLKIHPLELGGDNCGPWVRIYTGGRDGQDWRWCAGFVTFVLQQACVELGVKMPIAGSVSCDTLAAQARDAGLLITEKELKTNRRDWSLLGETFLFLVRRSVGDWCHVGIGLGGSPLAFSTVEGNTNDSGSANGYEVCARTRSSVSKDFICFS
jgi:hypothetical protein